jgi:hypothetical protein
LKAEQSRLGAGPVAPLGHVGALTGCGLQHPARERNSKGTLDDHPAAKVRIWRGPDRGRTDAVGTVELGLRPTCSLRNCSLPLRPSAAVVITPNGPAAALKQIATVGPPRNVRVASAKLRPSGPAKPPRQRSGERRHRRPRSAGRTGQRAAGHGVVPAAGFTNAGSRDNANRNRISAHGANGDTRGSRQTRSAPDWRRAAAACKRDGASSTHHLQHQPAYC